MSDHQFNQEVAEAEARRKKRETCSHTQEREEWIPGYEDDWGTHVQGRWHFETVSTTVDLDVGRFQCTQCGKVMYYTGTWKEFWEKGTPCAGSENAG